MKSGKTFSRNWQQYLLLVAILFTYEALCYYFIALKSPLHGDEHHFYRTSVSFSENLSFQRVKSYNELITPLTFLLYGLWGKLIGNGLLDMRFLSIIIGFFTHFLMFFLLKMFFSRQIILLWALFFLWIFNPYVIGFNAYIYTDGLSNLLIILFLLAFFKKQYGLIILSSALLIYTRQYNLILLIAAGITVLIHGLKTKIDYRMLLALTLGVISIAPLFIYWNGASPPGAMTNKLANVPHVIYFKALPVYVYCISVFTMPLSLLVLMKRKLEIKWVIFTFFLSGIYYLLFPVSASFISVKDGFFTVGLVDKALSAVFPSIFKHIILFLFFVLGNYVLLFFARHFIFVKKRLPNRSNWLVFIYIAIFLMSMVVNFQIWEKYFIQIFPVVLIMVGKISDDLLPELANNFKRFRKFEA